jgi:hypothetical protein
MADGGEAAAAIDEGNFVSREGVNVEFAMRPLRSEKTGPAHAGDWADISFRVTDASTGEPLRGRYPAAWMDLGKAWKSKGDRPMTCKDRVATYLQGIVGVRPMIDLNSHFLLVLNRDPSISVIDPAVGITGVTNLFAQINGAERRQQAAVRDVADPAQGRAGRYRSVRNDTRDRRRRKSDACRTPGRRALSLGRQRFGR